MQYNKFNKVLFSKMDKWPKPGWRMEGNVGGVN